MATEVGGLIAQLEDNICSVVLGKRDVVRRCLVALLAGEHLLLEDVPGVGKTLMAKALARSISGEFRRIQFTPDLLPSDILGGAIFNNRTSEFVFREGPLFANVVLADEINRAPPRTQSALLEAMSEDCISVDGNSYVLPRPFMVIATQNPYEFEGTYPLPESQLDRFLMRISMGYPDRSEERQVLVSHRLSEPVEDLRPVIGVEQVLDLQRQVREVLVEQSVADYLLDVVDATRTCEDLHFGVSTRGALNLYRAAQALALIEGRDFVVPDDIKRLAAPVLAHRVITRGFLQAGQRTMIEALIERLLEETPTPE
jgi:MoxR-like ATPase